MEIEESLLISKYRFALYLQEIREMWWEEKER